MHKTDNATGFTLWFFSGNDTFTSHTTSTIAGHQQSGRVSNGNDTFNMQLTKGNDVLVGRRGQRHFQFRSADLHGR